MTLADSNIWVALALAKHPFHSAVRDWFARQKLPTAVLFCRVTQHSFLRLLTTSAILAPFGLPPLTNQEAWATYQRFLADKRVSWVSEPRGIDQHWKKFAGIAAPSPKLWMDAYLAAFAFVGGYQLVSTDKGFKHFKGLNVTVMARA